ncbi:MAG TPA: hypothetical protein VF447_00935, partial [Terriglobales bacterium]
MANTAAASMATVANGRVLRNAPRGRGRGNIVAFMALATGFWKAIGEGSVTPVLQCMALETNSVQLCQRLADSLGALLR